MVGIEQAGARVLESGMHIATQLSVFLQNRPGTLAEICRVLARAKINIIAMTTADAIDHAVDRLVVSEPKKAVRLFEERGVLVIETEVLQIEGPNVPGGLGHLAQRLADAKINIEYLYFATPPNSRNGVIIVKCSNVKKAMKALNKKKER
jgi:hypothetical protein